jgi:hypothetical protein
MLFTNLPVVPVNASPPQIADRPSPTGTVDDHEAANPFPLPLLPVVHTSSVLPECSTNEVGVGALDAGLAPQNSAATWY